MYEHREKERKVGNKLINLYQSVVRMNLAKRPKFFPFLRLFTNFPKCLNNLLVEEQIRVVSTGTLRNRKFKINCKFVPIYKRETYLVM